MRFFLLFALVATSACAKDSVISDDTGASDDLVSQEQDTGTPLVISQQMEVVPGPWRPDHDVALQCPWLSEEYGPDANEQTLNCGPTTLVMAAACMNGFTPQTKDMTDLIHWMDDNIPSYHDSSVTNGQQLVDTMQGYYGIPASAFQTNSVSLQDLYGDLQAGVPVLIATYTQDGNTTDVMHGGYGHFMLLVGMTPTHIIVNDPQPWDEELGANHEYTIDSFVQEWQSKAGVRFLVAQ